MNSTIKKSLSVVMCTAMLASVAGCSSSGTPSTSTAPSQSSAASPASGSQAESAAGSSEAAPASDGTIAMPISAEPITLSYFIKMNSAMSATMPTYEDVECFKKLEEMTNIHIEWIHPSSNDQFNLMITSNDLPDLINWQLTTAKGGSEALINDGIIIPLTDKMAEFAPNYTRIMNANPELKKTTPLDDGTEYQFINFNYDPTDNSIKVFKILGPYIRKDWLDKVGLGIPKTTDEMYTVLKAFKDNDVNGNGDPNDEIPFVCGKSLEPVRVLSGAFGTRDSFHMKDGEVVYGPTQPEFKEYLTMINKWYSEGLINSDFPVNDNPGAKILSNEAGSTYASMGSGLIMQSTALAEEYPGAELVSMPWLTGPNGDHSVIYDSNANPRATAITTANKHVEESLRWIDYAYSAEGSMLTTFGIEGVSYEMKDGYPTLTDLVMNNTMGYNQEEAIARYCLGPINYPNARDYRFYEQVNLDTEMKRQIQVDWTQATEDICMPPITMNTQESAQYSSVMADIKTYVDEMQVKFMIGDESLDNFDTFVKNIEGMGIDQAIEIQKAALARYGQR